MGSWQHIEVEPRADGFGTAIRGVDLSAPLDSDVLAEVRAAWLEHRVAWFPEQPMGIEGLEAFTESLGGFGHDPYIAPMEAHPNVLEIRREASEKAGNFGAGWHSDWSFQDAPPAATLLHARVVPPVGGNTLYADGYRAYEALSPAMQALLDGLHTVHSARRPYGPDGLFARDTEARTMKIRSDVSAEATRLHPLVRTHPETGRKALFVNPTYTLEIDGFYPTESQALLDYLHAHMTQPEFVYSHQWEPNMLTIWDNRTVLHLAEGGYDGYQRIMYRTTVKGDVPT